MPENGGFPCSIDGLRVLATKAGRRTPSGKGMGQAALRVPGGQDIQWPVRASSEQESVKQPSGH